MLYSLMSVGKNFCVCLHAEQTIKYAEEGKTFALEAVVLGEGCMPALGELEGELFYEERIFLDFSYVAGLEEAVWEILLRVLQKWYANGNEIYLSKIPPQLSGEMEKRLGSKPFPMQMKQSEDGSFYAGITSNKGECLEADLWEQLTEAIPVCNLMMLMEEGAKGKAFDVERLLNDGECSIYYYLYELAMNMVKEKLANPRPEENSFICLLPDNAAAECMVKILSKLLGAEYCVEEEMRMKIQKGPRYMIVRDVIHMFCELNRLEAMLITCGGQMAGAICLLDINTGVGKRYNRVSYYCMDMSQGALERLKQRKYYSIAEEI